MYVGAVQTVSQTYQIRDVLGLTTEQAMRSNKKQQKKNRNDEKCLPKTSVRSHSHTFIRI
jgi:beta-lactam-binding protein with PASTA domain